MFLNASSGSSEEAAPLTPFMIHVWRQHGLDSEEMLERAPDRERFVYTFYDTFHQTRAPHRLAAAHQNSAMAESAGARCLLGIESHAAALGVQNCYLTRYMLHVWKKSSAAWISSSPQGTFAF